MPLAVDAAPERGRVKLVTWSLPERGPTGEVVVLLPDDSPPQDADSLGGGEGGPSSPSTPSAPFPHRWPLALLLHGRGEALKAPRDGAMGWTRDYGLDHAIARVNNPPLGPDDVQGFVDPDRLAYYNAQLAQHPFRGLVVVCPYLPDTNLRSHADLADYANYLADAVIPRARRELPVFASPAATGIDGVSLGGAVALRTGFARTDTFGAVAALQPAIGEDQIPEWVEVARAARARRRGMPLRLTTSHDDVYHDVITHLSAALREANVPHDFGDVPGPHDYPFNRGPGAIEVLLWHDRVLARG
jgi:hypothetical protein